MTLRELRTSPGAAWAGPLILLSALMQISSWVKSEASGAPWYLAQPNQWMFPVQTVLGLGLLAFWWKNYTLRPLGSREVLLAFAAGLMGIFIWILPSWLYDRGFVQEIPWLGFTSRDGEGFDPSMWAENPATYWTVVGLRLVRMTVLVAFAEELFWRGFLWRMISDPYRNFHQVPFAQRDWKSFVAVTALFTLIHSEPDRAAAVIYACIMGWLYLRTRSVGACVVAHAVSNLVLGIYILITRQWGFW